MKKFNLAIVDDESLFRKGLKRLICDNDHCQFLFEAGNGLELLEILGRRDTLPSVILLDIQMPIKDGIETLPILQQKYPDIQVIVISSHYNANLIIKMIELGASAFLSKSAEPEDLKKTIEEVVAKGFHYNDFIIQLMREKSNIKKKENNALTKREREVLHLICDQYTTKEIAEKLFLSPRTIEGHRNNLLLKTNSKNTAGLIIYAIENGIHSIKMKKLLLT